MSRGRSIRTEKRRRLVLRIRERDGDDCWICLTPMNFDVKPDQNGVIPLDYPTLDHIVPRVEQPNHDISNLKLAHPRCNELRGKIWELQNNRFRRPRENAVKAWRKSVFNR